MMGFLLLLDKYLAPPVRFELTANRLHFFSHYCGYGLYHHPFLFLKEVWVQGASVPPEREVLPLQDSL
jgi:hypothetical protein